MNERPNQKVNNEDLSLSLKRKINQYKRILLSLVLLIPLSAFIGGIMGFLVNQELTFESHWLFTLLPLIPIKRYSKYIKYKKDHENLTTKEIKGLHISKINKVLSKVFLSIIIVLLVVTGTLWFVLKNFS